LACFESLSNLPFAENRPTAETAQTLRNELLLQRATQTYLWARALINTLGMKVGSEKVFGVGYNFLPVWKKRLDSKTFVTTPQLPPPSAARHPSRHRQELETRRHRKGAVTAQRRLSDNPAGRHA
jgi:hypothetical protein